MEHSEGIREYIFTSHATFEMKRRGITESVARQVLENPQQRWQVRHGRDVFQSQMNMQGKMYLVRIFVDIERSPAEVVTAYRTTKIEKYWRNLS